MAEWISVKERLPEPEKRVMVALGEKSGFVAGTITIMFLSRGGEWITVAEAVPASIEQDLNVTHWQPLPEPPKEDDHDGI